MTRMHLPSHHPGSIPKTNPAQIDSGVVNSNKISLPPLELVSPFVVLVVFLMLTASKAYEHLTRFAKDRL
jgi:hypothetical protein